jgi:hypothetical protein
MAEDMVKQRIIASVFSKPGPSGVPEENYKGHVKIWEDAGASTQFVGDRGRKPRFIILSSEFTALASHKAKFPGRATKSIDTVSVGSSNRG